MGKGLGMEVRKIDPQGLECLFSCLIDLRLFWGWFRRFDGCFVLRFEASLVCLGRHGLEFVTGQWQNGRVHRKDRRFHQLRRFCRSRSALLGASYLTFLLIVFIGYSLFPRHSPTVISDSQFAVPSWEYWFGTDVHGRDLFSKMGSWNKRHVPNEQIICHSTYGPLFGTFGTEY